MKMVNQVNKITTDEIVVMIQRMKTYIKDILVNEDLKNQRALVKTVAKLLKNNDFDFEKARESFDAGSFMIAYNATKIEYLQ